MNLKEWFNQLGIADNEYQTICAEVKELQEVYGYKFVGIGARKSAKIENNQVIFGDYKPCIIGFKNILDHDFKIAVNDWVLGGREVSAIVDSTTLNIVF